MAIKPNLPPGGSDEGVYDGAMKGPRTLKAAEPFPTSTSPKIKGMESLHNDIGEMSGFRDSGYIVKKGTPYGEAAKFNFLPPGMDLDNQEIKDIRNMPLKFIVKESYAGDGWEPAPRDILE